MTIRSTLRPSLFVRLSIKCDNKYIRDSTVGTKLIRIGAASMGTMCTNQGKMGALQSNWFQMDVS
jgi:hypothetical protein